MSMQAKGKTGVGNLELNKNYLLDKFDQMDEEVSLITNQKPISHLDKKSLTKALIELEFYPLHTSYLLWLFVLHKDLLSYLKSLLFFQ